MMMMTLSVQFLYAVIQLNRISYNNRKCTLLNTYLMNDVAKLMTRKTKKIDV